jgi:hypothetical protein
MSELQRYLVMRCYFIDKKMFRVEFNIDIDEIP